MLKFLGILVLVALSFILCTTCIQLNWNWFITPLGAPPIGWLHGAGISTLIACFQMGLGLNWLDLREKLEIKINYPMRLAVLSGASATLIGLGAIYNAVGI